MAFLIDATILAQHHIPTAIIACYLDSSSGENSPHLFSSIVVVGNTNKMQSLCVSLGALPAFRSGFPLPNHGFVLSNEPRVIQGLGVAGSVFASNLLLR